jgi:hypothetical protein
MQIAKLWSLPRRRPPDKQVQAIVVCVDTGGPPGPGELDDRIETLAGRLRALVLERQLGEYDGCDRFSSEARLYLFSTDADTLASAVMDVVDAMSLSEWVRIRISLDPLGTAWRDVGA